MCGRLEPISIIDPSICEKKGQRGKRHNLNSGFVAFILSYLSGVLEQRASTVASAMLIVEI